MMTTTLTEKVSFSPDRVPPPVDTLNQQLNKKTFQDISLMHQEFYHYYFCILQRVVIILNE